MSTWSAEHLPPAYPDRAPWGTAERLRAWQQEALTLYQNSSSRDFLAVATPGAGKTTFALRVASELLAAKVVRAVTVVAPTEHLKSQWADAAQRIGIKIDAGFKNSDGKTARGFSGVVVTYAGVAAHPILHRNRTLARPTLVILDEIHHAGDARSWGEAVEEAFGGATRRLALTGTPFRSDTNPIPFVTYAPGPDGIPRSVADYVYGYGQALADSVVRPVVFLAYAGSMRWRTRAGDELSATLGDPLTQDLTNQAWRTALDPSGEWVPAVLRAADKRLSVVRRSVPDAGAMVIASDQNAARAYARILREITGRAPTVVLSDDKGASGRIGQFATGEDRWLVAVRMVSEGVDIPRLAVGVYATNAATPLFFAQAVGRFVRARRRGEIASVFVPTVAPLLAHAAELERTRDHVLGRALGAGDDPFAEEEALLAAAQQANDGVDDSLGDFEALGSEATFDRVMFGGAEFGLPGLPGSREEQDFLGLPGLLDADQVTAVLAKRQADQVKAQTRRNRRSAGAGEAAAPLTADRRPVATHAERSALRRELHTLVGAWHHRTGGSHGAIHAELRRLCGGPATAAAGVDELRQRVDTLRRWVNDGKP
ncbi:MAG: DEAD/DEAH box helicase [Sporichthyaceae bacterium]